MDKTYRVVLSSGFTFDLSAMFVENLKAAIADAALRWEPYLVNEDGPYVIPAHVALIEILHGDRRTLSEAVAVGTMDVSELVELEPPA